MSKILRIICKNRTNASERLIIRNSVEGVSRSDLFYAVLLSLIISDVLLKSINKLPSCWAAVMFIYKCVYNYLREDIYSREEHGISKDGQRKLHKIGRRLMRDPLKECFSMVLWHNPSSDYCSFRLPFLTCTPPFLTIFS